VCRPDPDNPGQQICKTVRSSDTIDPFEGNSSSRSESEEQRPGRLNGPIPDLNEFFHSKAPKPAAKGSRVEDSYEDVIKRPAVFRRVQRFFNKMLNLFDFNEAEWPHQDPTNFDRVKDIPQV